eukprot:GHUV01043266.1.p1 GENE.GHUV01043266.1~~GHUV01043266.1.p1  ORF type:complete len:147 (+),score=35.83 GHUV01043266.1:609-1049(+)
MPCICTGGMGKTTLAKLLFNPLAQHFRHSALIELQHDGHISSEHISSLLEQLGAEGFKKTSPAGVLLRTAQDYVSGKAVLIVVDNVWTQDQLDKLLPREFTQGSRVIITSRYSDLPKSEWCQQVTEVIRCNVYAVSELGLAPATRT